MPEEMPKTTNEFAMSQEQLQTFQSGEATLLDIYSDRVVTFKGITAPLGALVKLCPVPAEEMDPQKVNNWTANIIVETGGELDEGVITFVEIGDAKKKF